MILRVTITSKVKYLRYVSRSESEPEEGVESAVADAKPSDLHTARVKSR